MKHNIMSACFRISTLHYNFQGEQLHPLTTPTPVPPLRPLDGPASVLMFRIDDQLVDSSVEG